MRKVCVRLFAICLLIGLLAACQGAVTPISENIRPGDVVSAPEWREGINPVTLENVDQLAYIGRLSPPGDPSTQFESAISPDGTRMTALNTNNLVAWDLVTGDVVFSTARSEASHVFYAPDKTEIYTLNSEGVLLIHDANTGALKDDLLAHPNFNNIVGFHADNGWMAVGGLDGSVKVWDPFERISRVTIDAHTLQVLGLAFSSDGSLLATAGQERVVTVWDWAARTALISVSDLKGDPVQVAISPDSTQLAVATLDEARLYSLPDGTLQHTLSIGRGGATDIMRFSPDGRYLLNSGQAADMTLWDVQNGAPAAQLPGVGGLRTSAAFSPDGAMLLTNVFEGETALWKTADITDAQIGRAALAVGTDQIIHVDWTPDGRLLLLFDASGPVYVWGIPAAP